MDCSPPGSSVHGILQARVLKRVAMPSSREEGPRDQTRVSCIADSLPPGPSGKPLTILPQGTKWSKSYCYSRRPVKTLLQIQSLWQFPQIPGSARSPSLGSWNSLELITNGLLLFLFPFSCSHSDVYSGFLVHVHDDPRGSGFPQKHPGSTSSWSSETMNISGLFTYKISSNSSFGDVFCLTFNDSNSKDAVLMMSQALLQELYIW